MYPCDVGQENGAVLDKAHVDGAVGVRVVGGDSPGEVDGGGSPHGVVAWSQESDVHLGVSVR